MSLSSGTVSYTHLDVYKRQFGQAPLPPLAVFLAGATIAWLLLPLMHYLLFTPADFRYITTASNFFANSPAVQALSLAVAALLAWLPGLAWRRGGLAHRSSV